MYCLIIKYNEDWIIFTNEVWISKDEANDYAKRNNIEEEELTKVIRYIGL